MHFLAVAALAMHLYPSGYFELLPFFDLSNVT